MTQINPSTNSKPLLEMDNIDKRFPGVLALEGAQLTVRRGEVHALIGQNGAGKSTLIKILTGAYRRDGGNVRFEGREVDFPSTAAAQKAGIATIYQEVNLIGMRSAAENILLGREPRRFGLIDWRALNARAHELLSKLGVQIDVRQPLSHFSTAIQQMVALARALSVHSSLVVMDEPTSSLDEREVGMLFDTVHQLRAEGVSVLFVSHRLDELYAVCDRVTIMRDGKTVLERDLAGLSKLELVGTMLGRELGEVRLGQTGFTRKREVRGGAPLLEARSLHRGVRLREVNLEIKPGEIVGLSGLLGSGRTETARAVFGVDLLEGGEVSLGGRKLRLRDPRDAIRAGIGLCSEDRKVEGIIPYLSVRENLTLALLPRLAQSGIIDEKRQLELVEKFITRLGIKTAGPEQPIRELSGGNQQKVLLARWLVMNPRLLILDEPTRGIDVGAKAEIQRLIDELAGEGLGVLMISSELEEMTEGADRVVVMRDGVSVSTLEGEAITADALIEAMAGTEAGEM